MLVKYFTCVRGSKKDNHFVYKKFDRMNTVTITRAVVNDVNFKLTVARGLNEKNENIVF